ncbi:uncharacterized protein K460DRAFT_41305 [Cucurbitaria berberidis CBS 394.84]|uniref:Wax synthase domain-containing protein n=1 Tax=Cucurbitaria berberidis CBS 394.84 TaxID=1168544 RepID=A0A9P4GUV2_9PLEO|nr:uncharacterized protein K460DRAFT_41305 [Cucurbitaria berberidis CBS 394.84]KAF1851785.1 hypothetical protein K460DRAFT_41305 [Cucurbitaria berberidis CBS 394.84]
MAVSLELPPIFALLQVPLIYLVNIVALAIGPRHQFLRVLISLPAVVLLLCQGLYREGDSPWAIQYGMNCAALSATLTYVDWTLLCSPDKEGWYKIQYNKPVVTGKEKENSKTNGLGKKSNEAVVPVGFRSRLWWGVRLATTNRYVGWSCQVKNVPVQVDADYPRLRFVARKSLKAIFLYLVKDALFSYTASTPHGSWTDILSVKPAISYSSYPFWHRFWYAWVNLAMTCVSMEMLNSAYGAVSVATGLANPRDCPSTFGDVRKMTSVRNTFSTVWHQQCRRICSAPGIFIVRDVLHLPKGSLASGYIQLFIAFSLSGLVHGGASMLIHRSFNDDRAYAFFISQAMIIIIEGHFIVLGKHLGLKDSLFWRCIGFFWTVFVIGASFDLVSSRTNAHGMWIHDRERDWFGIGPKVVP